MTRAVTGPFASPSPAMTREPFTSRRSIDVLRDGAVDRYEIEPPVVVDVEPRGAKSGERQRRLAQTSEGAALLEHAAAGVHVQIGALAGELGDEQILVAVVVEIAGVHAHARLRLAICPQSGTRQKRGVLERSVALVDPQLVRLTVVGDVDVNPAVAVEIAGCHAERGTELGRQAAARGDVGKGSVAIVPVQLARLR